MEDGGLINDRIHRYPGIGLGITYRLGKRQNMSVAVINTRQTITFASKHGLQLVHEDILSMQVQSDLLLILFIQSLTEMLTSTLNNLIFVETSDLLNVEYLEWSSRGNGRDGGGSRWVKGGGRWVRGKSGWIHFGCSDVIWDDRRL